MQIIRREALITTRRGHYRWAYMEEQRILTFVDWALPGNLEKHGFVAWVYPGCLNDRLTKIIGVRAHHQDRGPMGYVRWLAIYELTEPS